MKERSQICKSFRVNYVYKHTKDRIHAFSEFQRLKTQAKYFWKELQVIRCSRCFINKEALFSPYQKIFRFSHRNKYDLVLQGNEETYSLKFPLLLPLQCVPSSVGVLKVWPSYCLSHCYLRKAHNGCFQEYSKRNW